MRVPSKESCSAMFDTKTIRDWGSRKKELKENKES